MKKIIKKILPKSILNFYHKLLAIGANFLYGHPSEKMIVIGVTGTKGKSTVINMIAQILEEAEKKVGFTSTVNIKVGEREWLNKYKMTMVGRFSLQRLLNQMVKAKCDYAIIEVTSEGLIQHRAHGINFDIVVFTNLSPEHIESHGSYENYKRAKGILFQIMEKSSIKKIKGNLIPKTSVVNLDDKEACYFSQFQATKKLGYTLLDSEATYENQNVIRGYDLEMSGQRTKIKVQDTGFNLKLLGKFNVYNSLAALSVALSQGINLEIIKKALEKIEQLPGRQERINVGQEFQIIVDYAHEPYSLAELYEAIRLISKNKIIHILGSAGGGRDKSRRPVLGEIAGRYADYVIVSNEDPYDEDPMQIIEEVAAGALKQGKVLNQNLFKILDRREAIKKAISLAHQGDLILATGKGAEQYIMSKGGKKIPWDEREVFREELKKRLAG